MITIRARNAQSALVSALGIVRRPDAVREVTTRNGSAFVAVEPVTTMYQRPMECVVLWPARAANPFFHLMEALWMLAGRNDVAALSKYVGRMAEYSDDGATFHGAYGKRWRRHFGRDQLRDVILGLSHNPACRRQVVQIWDARADLGRDGRDIPCNLVVHFLIRGGGSEESPIPSPLDMTVFCRSNDILWGCYGANAVHFAFLQSYVAAALGRPVGRYWQISDDWHAYLGKQLDRMLSASAPVDPYLSGDIQPWSGPLASDVQQFDEDLKGLLDGAPGSSLSEPFLREIAAPIRDSHATYRIGARGKGLAEQALELLPDHSNNDWIVAARNWLLCRVAR